MPNIAILIGNTDYRSLIKLDCCRADVAAMKELVDTTEKYDTVVIIENAEANDLKAKIRAVTQARGIGVARFRNPDAAIHVERVRDVGPGRDKWRKI